MYITALNISKSYGETQALRDVSFEIKQNELFGFIGPDGGGKTTLFRILVTLLLADSGSITINGWDVVKEYKTIRNNVGYMPGRFSLYQDLSVEENLTFFATIFGTTIKENYDLIQDIYSQIEPFKNRQAGKLSGGMKQKLALSCALIHKPHLLILDEPTTGVDAVSRKEFWDMLKRLRQKGITILVSTPYMDEAVLCDRVALIQQGKILQINTPEGIVENYPNKLFAIHAGDLYKLKNDLLQYPNCKSAHLFGQHLHYTDKTDNLNYNEIQEYLLHKGNKELIIESVKPGIEDCFISLMTEIPLNHE